MSTRDEKHPQQAIEEMCEVISLADQLKVNIIVRRHQELSEVVERLRQHAERGNGHICRAYFRRDHLNDLESPTGAA